MATDNIRHFRWRGMSFDPDGRRSSTYQCELCNEMIKELDSHLHQALDEHDQNRHAPAVSASGA